METHTAREHVFQLLYELELKPDTSVNDVLELYYETTDVSPKSQEYINGLVGGIYENNESLNKTIEKYLRGWTLQRISKISLAGLKLAIYEMENNEKITPAIAISEAVKLVAKYEGEEASSFVNGVLGQHVRSSSQGGNDVVE